MDSFIPQQDPGTMPASSGVPLNSNPTAPAGLTPDAALEHPLRPLVHDWLKKIELGLQLKKSQFQDDANEAMRFFHGPYDFMYEKKYAASSPGFRMSSDQEQSADFPAPTFMMTANKVAEMVQIFGPVLYHQNPDRKVNPRKPPDMPMGLVTNPADPFDMMTQQMLQQQAVERQGQDAARARLIETYLNYTPNELGLKDDARQAIDETLIKGMGVLWTELFQPPGSPYRLAGSFWDSTDNLVIDPDAEQLKDAKWVARRCIHPVWETERKYGYPPGTLRANVESYAAQAGYFGDPDADFLRKQGRSNDLIIYWKIWSKMGVGAKLQGAPPYLVNTLDQFGDYCYLVLAENIPYPLNVPPDLIASPGATQQLQQRIQWPTPFYLTGGADGGWPFTPFVFHRVPRRCWPMSHLKPAMGELKFLNWCYSFLASKVRVNSRDFLAMLKSAGDEMKDAILHGRDYTLIELSATHPKSINEIIQFLQHPAMNGDIFKVIEIIEHNFELRTGLTELAYGESGRQMRSAQEANLKHEQLSVRPDDMATRVEESMTEVGRKEALLARWHLTAGDVKPVLGPLGAYYWQQTVTTMDLYDLAHELEYRIEAGSTRKPNRQRDADNANQAMQTLFQPLFQYGMQAANFGPVNALTSFWCKTLGMEPQPFMLTAPPPMMMPPGGPGGGPPAPGGPPHPAQPHAAPPAGPPPGPPPGPGLGTIAPPLPPPGAGPGAPGPAGPPGLPGPGGMPPMMMPPEPQLAPPGNPPGVYPDNPQPDFGPGGTPIPPAVEALLGALMPQLAPGGPPAGPQAGPPPFGGSFQTPPTQPMPPPGPGPADVQPK